MRWSSAGSQIGMNVVDYSLLIPGYFLLLLRFPSLQNVPLIFYLFWHMLHSCFLEIIKYLNNNIYIAGIEITSRSSKIMPVLMIYIIKIVTPVYKTNIT